MLRRSRGRSSNRRIPQETLRRVRKELKREEWSDFGPPFTDGAPVDVDIPILCIGIASNASGSVIERIDLKSLKQDDVLKAKRVADHLRNYRSYRKAGTFVHKLELKSQTEWSLYRKGELPDKPIKPDDIPADPYTKYKDEG